MHTKSTSIAKAIALHYIRQYRELQSQTVLSIPDLKRLRELKRVLNTYRSLTPNPRTEKGSALTLFLSLMAILSLCALSACSGIGFSAEIHRIDETRSETVTHETPLRCLFVKCPNEVPNEK